MSIEIKIHSSIVMHAIEQYVKEQYGLDADLDIHSENCAVSEGVVMIDYKKLDPVYKKYKNGRIVKDEYGGHPIIDYKKSKLVDKWLEFDDSCEITFHLNNREGW
jgi:hypothetical protein